MPLNKNYLQEQIEIFKSEIKLPNFQPKTDIQPIIDMASSAAILANTTPLHLMEMSVQLAAYATFITVQENRLLAYMNWCESTTKTIVGRELQNAQGYGFQEKDLSIRANNEHIVEIEKIKKITQAKYEMIKGLSYKILFLSERLESLAREKKNTLRE